MKGTMMLEPWEEDRFGLNDDFPGGPNLDMGQIGGTGLDAEGMGTTGSLGVSFAAPLTRGGFAGEIFDSAPMPTGNWRNAPTPVMLGTATDNQASEGVPMWIIAAGLAAVAYYVMTQSRQKTVDQDADDARMGNPRFRRFNRRWMR
jgi:hypothetical protein